MITLHSSATQAQYGLTAAHLAARKLSGRSLSNEGTSANYRAIRGAWPQVQYVRPLGYGAGGRQSLR